MPEGDTIFRSARALQKALGGRVVTAFEAQVATVASVADSKRIVGRVVEKVEARGKWCLVYFSGDLILVTHMLMSGSWHIYRVGERWRVPGSSVRLMLRVGESSTVCTDVLAGGQEHRFPSGMTNQGTDRTTDLGRVVQAETGFVALAVNVPVMEFHTERTLLRYSQVPKLGVDILGEGYSTETGVGAMREYAGRQPEAEVGVTLLNQRVMAGLGNVYKSEVAFAAGVNPFRQMRTVTERELQVMAEVSGRYMRANVANGSSATGGDAIVTYAGNRRTTHSMNAGERLWVYGRQGQECRRCGALVMMRKQGEQARSTYWCPVCQPWVAAAGQSEEAPVGRMVKVLGSRRRGSC